MISKEPNDQGWECPTGCGSCCYGVTVALGRSVLISINPNEACRYLGPYGCSLPRSARPPECLNYLCPTVAENTEDYLDDGYQENEQIIF